MGNAAGVSAGWSEAASPSDEATLGTHSELDVVPFSMRPSCSLGLQEKECELLERATGSAPRETRPSSHPAGGGASAPNSIQDFDLLEVIGNGGFAKVWKARLKDTDDVYAIKIQTNDPNKASNQAQALFRERQVLETADCPFVVKLHWALENFAYSFLVLTHVPGGTLFQLQNAATNQTFTEHETAFYAMQTSFGLKYLHDHQVCFRDLKPENLLIDAHGNVVLADFGLSKVFDSKSARHSSILGTPEYMAPEMIQGNGYSLEVDYWALGCLVYEMLHSSSPFYEPSTRNMFVRILTANCHAIDNSLSAEARSLVHGLIHADANERFQHSQLRKHPFFRSWNWSLVERRKCEPPIKPRPKKKSPASRPASQPSLREPPRMLHTLSNNLSLRSSSKEVGGEIIASHDDQAYRAGCGAHVRRNADHLIAVDKFIELRSRSCLDRSAWAEILDERFIYVLPNTRYRQQVAAHFHEDQKVLLGIDMLVHDLMAGMRPVKPHVSVTGELNFNVNHNNVMPTEDGLIAMGHLESKSTAAVTRVVMRFFLADGLITRIEQVLDVAGFGQQFLRAVESQQTIGPFAGTAYSLMALPKRMPVDQHARGLQVAPSAVDVASPPAQPPDLRGAYGGLGYSTPKRVKPSTPGDVGDTPPMSRTPSNPSSCLSTPRQIRLSTMRNLAQSSFAELEFLEQVGEGKFGSVWRARSGTTGQVLAVKCVMKNNILDAQFDVNATLEEHELHSKLSHPFIVELYTLFQTSSHWMLVMGYVPGGSLSQHSADMPQRRFGEDAVRFYGSEIALALHHIHSHRIVLRDLKPEHVLLTKDGHVKLVDFGLAFSLDDAQSVSKAKAASDRGRHVGNVEYTPPELLSSFNLGIETDWWSFGCLLAELLTGKSPFWHADMQVMHSRIALGFGGLDLTQLGSATEIGPHTPPLLQGLLAVDPKQRFRWDDVETSPFFTAVLAWDDVLAKVVEPPFVPATSTAPRHTNVPATVAPVSSLRDAPSGHTHALAPAPTAAAAAADAGSAADGHLAQAEQFFRLFSDCCPDAACWRNHVEPTLILTTPNLPFRSQAAATVCPVTHTLCLFGVDELTQDMENARLSQSHHVSFAVDRSSFYCTQRRAFAGLVISASDASSPGAVKLCYSFQGKLTSVELCFDVHAFMAKWGKLAVPPISPLSHPAPARHG